MPLFSNVLILFIVGIVGTGAGGLIVACLGTPTKKTLSSLLGFAGGVMVSVVAFDLMPEAFEIGGTATSLVGFLAGCVSTMSIDLILPHMHHASVDKTSSRLARTAVVVTLGIAMHNIPEGLAVGAGDLLRDELAPLHFHR